MRSPLVLALAPELQLLSRRSIRASPRWLSTSPSLGAPRSSKAPATSTSTSSTTPPSNPQSQTPQQLSELAPHRRRQARKQALAQATSSEAPLPPDASSLLTSAAAAQPKDSFRRTFSTFLSLSKPRLTVLVVLSAMAPYALYPVPEMLMPTMTETPSLSPLTLFFLTTGTALCSASANTLNMLYEPSTDAKMTRTRNRPLVRGLISNRAAALFAILCGAAGAGALYFGVNPTVSFLGLSNIVLYAGVYTPLKAVTAFNTWVGAVVGGIPPLMGWAAAAGEAATKDGSWRELLLASDGSSIGGWLLAGLLFAWQFPHFMALSWPIREEYKAAGLRMLAWTNPARNGRVALRYSLVFFPLCFGLCAAGVTDWYFALTSLPINLWLAREAVRFWKFEGHKGSARGLFWASVWHLPGVMILALLHKKGMWSRAWRSVFGDDEEGEWEEEELEEMASMTATTVAQKDESTQPGR
ncbi:ubiA prenyltransferase family domain-containing protein [Trichoderma breve]|uniref:Protoheme IX farnesyltransferase, mitochondrial n=1 Tax=Trichoderma breve TaxID=2034170 RepID=A0A9W9BM76_9HYPO|nr:ubiA prenyltransferase family domain-containing protein [Trichoderma breve]KAJ4862528.1 ubiA prenyltransferase family domain-containing protein [Trichoderma breve]